MANDYPELSRAVPSINHPIIDRQLRPSQVWYPYFVKLAGFIDGIANGELIVDGKITTNLIAADAITADLIATNAVVADAILADAVTADKLAANSVTAANAAIANAAVDTLQIAGNAVTLASSAEQTTQTSFTATSKTNVLTLSMTTSGTQPLLVSGVLTASGATSVASPGDYSYEGLFWENNTTDEGIEIDVTVGGQTSNPILTSVPAAQAVCIPFHFVFSSVSSGSQTIALRALLTPGSETIGIRDVVIVGLETKR